MHGGREARHDIPVYDLQLGCIEQAPAIRRHCAIGVDQRRPSSQNPREDVGLKRDHGVGTSEAPEPSRAEPAWLLTLADPAERIAAHEARGGCMPRVDAGDGLIDPLDLATLADGFDKLRLEAAEFWPGRPR